VVTQGRATLFGEVVDGVMRLTAAGRMVQTVWDELPTHYPVVLTDAFQIMPNHIHGIVVLTGAGAATVGAAPCGRPDLGADTGACPYGALSLPDVMHRFETMTIKRYADGVRNENWPAFEGRLWQRNYYEHIVRDPDDWARIHRYIAANPALWLQDAENPQHAL
jgi:REP element-mobilizing transposase RayT